MDPINKGLPTVNVGAISINPANPEIIYAGDMNSGWISQSTNGGRSWDRTYSRLLYCAAILTDPKTVQTLYASDYSYLVKSIDGGTNWATVASSGGGVLMRDPQNSQIIYASMTPSFQSQSHLFKSTDDGTTWRDLAVDASILAIDPISTNILYAYTSAPALFKSTDGGSSWTSLGVLQSYAHSIAVRSGDSCYLYGHQLQWRA